MYKNSKTMRINNRPENKVELNFYKIRKTFYWCCFKRLKNIVIELTDFVKLDQLIIFMGCI